jgi:hypothetical protein
MPAAIGQATPSPTSPTAATAHQQQLLPCRHQLLPHHGLHILQSQLLPGAWHRPAQAEEQLQGLPRALSVRTRCGAEEQRRQPPCPCARCPAAPVAAPGARGVCAPRWHESLPCCLLVRHGFMASRCPQTGLGALPRSTRPAALQGLPLTPALATCMCAAGSRDVSSCRGLPGYYLDGATFSKCPGLGQALGTTGASGGHLGWGGGGGGGSRTAAAAGPSSQPLIKQWGAVSLLAGCSRFRAFHDSLKEERGGAMRHLQSACLRVACSTPPHPTHPPPAHKLPLHLGAWHPGLPPWARAPACRLC